MAVQIKIFFEFTRFLNSFSIQARGGLLYISRRGPLPGCNFFGLQVDGPITGGRGLLTEVYGILCHSSLIFLWRENVFQ